jgi:hypothetical protein
VATPTPQSGRTHASPIGRRIVRIGFERRQIQGYTTAGPAHRYVSAAGYRPIVYGIRVCHVEEFNRVSSVRRGRRAVQRSELQRFPHRLGHRGRHAAVDMAKERALVARARRCVGAPTALRRYLEARQAEVVDSVASTMRRRSRIELRLGSVGHGSGPGCVGGAGQPPVAAP